MNNRLKQIRKELDLSQDEFGKKIGMQSNSISTMESGVRPIVERTVIAVVKEFGVSRDWLETGDGEMFDQSDARITVVLEDILKGEDEVGKALLKTIATFSDEEWTLLRKMLDRLVKEYRG